MKSRTFNVPADSSVDFAELLEEYGLEGFITGRNDDNELLVRVEYDPQEDSEAILEIMEQLEDLDEEDEDEEDDDDE
nr:hypothetical protein [uncultured Carboxylicivirga sp.]